VILISLAAAVLALQEPAPALVRKVWYEVAEADLTCTALADESERGSLNAPFLENPRDSSNVEHYFGATVQDERRNEFRYLGVLAAIGWWANRFNDQTLLINVYNTIGVRADQYLTSHPNDILFKQIARCARTHVLFAVLEEDQPDQANKFAAMLQQSFASDGPSLPVEDWPLLLALREAALEPKASNAINRLTKVAIDLAGAVMRANQKARARRLLTAAAGGAEALGDTTAAREIILLSMTGRSESQSAAEVAGVQAPQAVKWRWMPVLYDSQLRLTGEKDAANLSQMLTPPTPPAELIDQRTVFESYLRLSMAARSQGRWDDASKFNMAAFQAVAGYGGALDTHSLLFMRHALGALDAGDVGLPGLGGEGLPALLVRNDPAWRQRTLLSVLELAEELLARNPLSIGTAREHVLLNHQIDVMLAGLTDLREAMPSSRDRIDDLSFRLAQERSYGRLTVAMVSGETSRAQLSSAFRSDVEEFLHIVTRSGFALRGFFNEVLRWPGQPPPNGDALWPVMSTLDWVNLTSSSSKYSGYVEYLRRIVPTIAALATAHPLHLIEFQRLLRPGEALVATQVTPSALYIWAITPGGVQVVRQRITEAEVTNTVTRFRASLKPSVGSGEARLPPFDAATAYKLYSLIFAPIAGQLRDVRTLIWYGQGPLGAVPPAVLIAASPATPTATTAVQFGGLAFLVDRFAIAVLPDLSMFPQLRARPSESLRAGGFLGVGGPGLSADEVDGARRARSDELARGFTGQALADGLTDQALADLPKLPESADEMKALAALFPAGKSTLRLGPAADEHGIIGDKLREYGIIAFATHGFLADEIQNVHEPSLMLALAPSATDRFDGILTTSEIAGLRLSADLVILTACNTAGADGRPHGDTFTGLTQAFFDAGARNVMVSQWPVMSGAAVQLSVGTVERALNGKETLARSLQLAMQALRKAAVNALEAHPAYWGPFVITGDGR